MSEDGNAFDELIAGLDPAMAVVTTVSGGERAGCLIGFHAQCSISPPRYVVWLSKANHTFRVGVHARWFAVHFLSEDDEELARLFGTTSGDDTDKFAECDWADGGDGLPLLTGCANRFMAERVALLDEGSDHVCLVISPTNAWAGTSFRPLRLSMVEHLQPGHESEERPKPAEERSA